MPSWWREALARGGEALLCDLAPNGDYAPASSATARPIRELRPTVPLKAWPAVPRGDRSRALRPGPRRFCYRAVMSSSAPPTPPSDPFAPLPITRSSPSCGARRDPSRLHHPPVELLYPVAPVAADQGRVPLVVPDAGGGAITIDLLRITNRACARSSSASSRDPPHREEFNLLGSTYLLLASLLAIEIFPAPVAPRRSGSRCWASAFAPSWDGRGAGRGCSAVHRGWWLLRGVRVWAHVPVATGHLAWPWRWPALGRKSGGVLPIP